VSEGISIALPPELVDAVADRVVEILDERGDLGSRDPWLDVDEAAAHLRASRQRIYDLVHSGRLHPGRDGRRLVFKRSELDAYLEGRAA
jgi:excisionase family DNA binding protein